MNCENSDFRKKHILHPGDIIVSGQTAYTITDDFVAYGGSAVIYSSISSEFSQENPIKYVIKEVYPNEDLFERSAGIIRSRDPENMEELKWHRKHIAEEHKLGGLCYNGTNLAVPIHHIIRPNKITIDGKEYSEDIQDGVFAVLDDLSGKAISFTQMLEYIKQPKSEDRPLRNGGSPTLHTTACLIEQVLLTLRAIHNNGVLFGDIHMDNVWFAKDCLELGIIHTSCFMDFGCSRPLIDGKRTDIVKGRVFSSKGFTPPELLPDRWARGDGTISVQADIFSVGCLMLRCLFPEEYWELFGKSPVIGPRTLQRDDMKRLGIDNALRKKTNDILVQAMNPDPEKRYPNADAMLKDIQALIEHMRPPKNKLNLSFSALAPGEFRGRDEEIKAIDCRISEHRKPIELYGFGGMGKSELAIEYCRRKMESNGIRVHFVRFDKTILNTIVGPIADAFSGYSRFTEQGMPKSESMIYSEVMKMLGEQSEEDILCIDNVDSETEEFADLCGKEYADLCRLRMNLIITTRFDRTEFGGIEVGALQRKHLYGMMTHILQDSPLVLTERQMDDLIQVVDAHTLAVELIARTLKMNRPRLAPEALLEKLKSRDLGGTSFTKIASHKDRDLQKRRIEDHIKTLFQITSLPPDELSYMKNAILMDTRRGLPYDWFAEAQPNFNPDTMEHLIDRGWVKINRQTDELNFHPLIHKIAKAQFLPTEEDNGLFLHNMWSIFQRYKSDGDICNPIASLFCSVEQLLLDDWIDELCSWYDVSIERLKLRNTVRENGIVAYKAQINGEFDKALAYVHEAMEIIPKNMAKFYGTTGQIELGKLYRREGLIYQSIGNYGKMRSSLIRASELGDAQAMNIIANQYIDGKTCTQNYTEAIYWLNKSHALNNAIGSNNLGWMYLHGYGVPKNINVAIQLFMEAADNTESPCGSANRHLGRIFLGVHPDAPDYPTINPEKALFHLQKAKDLGVKDVDELIEQAYSMLNTANL